VAEACTGASAACPADNFAAAGTSCRPVAGACDAAEVCAGTAATCPADAPVPDGTGCSGGSCFIGVCKPADVMAIAGGGSHSLAVKINGEVWAWGSDSAGQLGNGSGSGSSATPVGVTNLAGATAVSAGSTHSLALLDNGEVWAWGADTYGQLGDGGTSVNRQAPVWVVGLPDVAVAVSAGGNHSLALLADGTVWAWGRNSYGALGASVGATSQSPVWVAALPTQAVAIAAGGDHSLAVLADGTVWAWGRDIYGQLGNGGAAANSTTPVQAIGLPDVAVSVAAGGNHSLALLASGEVWSWGHDLYGQLGNGGTATNAMAPVMVVGLPEVVTAIAAGGNHSLALLASGSVVSWGHDGSGQLGDGAGATNHQSPVPIVNLTEVSMLAAGTSHSLALKFDGTAWAWGLDSGGQLGNDSVFSSKYTPVQAVMP
jgi:alpha-tubulin suppressor-like RCC1 family protein